ncbi:MAG: AI-2E family transporter [Patescibacteria group bacterium]
MGKSISYSSILKVFVVIIGIWFLYQILDVVAIVIFSIIISSVVAPMIDKMQLYKIPRILGGVIIYVVIIFIIGLVLFLIIPPLAQEIATLAKQLPYLINNSDFLSLSNDSTVSFIQFLNQLSGELPKAASSFWGWGAGLVGGIGNIIFVFVISFFLSVQDNGLKQLLRDSLPIKYQQNILNIIFKSQKTLSHWLKGQLILMFLVGLLTFIGLQFVNVPYKLSLAILAGLLEIITFEVPLIAAIPAIIFGAGISLITAVIIAVIYFIIQRVENTILVPYVMKWAMQMNPILVLIAILVGVKVGGVTGMLLSVPLLAVGIEFFKKYYNSKSVTRNLTEKN